VKHFCPIGAENLTSAHTPRGFETCGIARKIGIVGGWLERLCVARAIQARTKAMLSRAHFVLHLISARRNHGVFNWDFRAKFLILAQRQKNEGSANDGFPMVELVW
jgi:hypothetical protein